MESAKAEPINTKLIQIEIIYDFERQVQLLIALDNKGGLWKNIVGAMDSSGWTKLYTPFE